MALDNIRERLALHFDAEASLESTVTRDSYEVHIRMPYRTHEAGAERHADDEVRSGPRAATTAARASGASRAAARFPRQRATRIEPWLNRRCAS